MTLLATVGEQASHWATVFATVISAVSLWIAIRVNYDAKRPQVIASFEFDSDKNIVRLVVQNIGEGAAYNVQLSGFDDSVFMSSFRPQVLNSFVTKGIPILVSGSKRSTVVAGGRIMDEMRDKSSNLTVSYSERGFIRSRIQVEETFMLEYSSFSGALYTDSETKLVRRALEKMEKEVKGLKEAIENML